MSAPLPAEATSAIAKELGESLKVNFVTKEDGEGLQKGLNELREAVNKVQASINVGNDNRAADPAAGFKHFGEYAIAVEKAATEHKVDERLLVLKGTGTPSGSSTLDFPLPAAFSPQIKSTDYSSEDLSALATNVPIDPGVQSIELTYADDTDRSGGLIYGGIQAYFKSEAEQMTSTTPKKRNIRLEPQEAYAFAYATDKLLRNSPIAYGAWLQDGMSKALRFLKSNAIINGDGAAKPRGLLNSPDKITVAKETSQTAATINEVNLAKMWKRMPANWRNSAIWLCNQDVEDQFDLMARAAYGVSATINPNIDTILYNRENGTLKGRPVVFTEFCQTLGTEGDIILWSPSKYLVAQKVGSGMQQSIHFKFDTAQTAFRVTIEIDGKSEYPAALTPFKGSVTRSSIVTLAVRA